MKDAPRQAAERASRWRAGWRSAGSSRAASAAMARSTMCGISEGVREISAPAAAPLPRDAQTLGLWNFDDLVVHAAAKPADLASVPDTFIIPAAKTEELTKANGWPKLEEFRKWERSLGGPTSNRFSALTQITKQNVAQLEVAWTYHSGDGTANMQCNPIIVDGVMFAPTGGLEHRRARRGDRQGAMALQGAEGRQAARRSAGAARAALLAGRCAESRARDLRRGHLALRARSEDRPAARQLRRERPHQYSGGDEHGGAQFIATCSSPPAMRAMSSATTSAQVRRSGLSKPSPRPASTATKRGAGSSKARTAGAAWRWTNRAASPSSRPARRSRTTSAWATPATIFFPTA